MYKKELHNNRVLGNFFSIKFVHIRKSCLNLIPMKIVAQSAELIQIVTNITNLLQNIQITN